MQRNSVPVVFCSRFARVERPAADFVSVADVLDVKNDNVYNVLVNQTRFQRHVRELTVTDCRLANGQVLGNNCSQEVPNNTFAVVLWRVF